MFPITIILPPSSKIKTASTGCSDIFKKYTCLVSHSFFLPSADCQIIGRRIALALYLLFQPSQSFNEKVNGYHYAYQIRLLLTATKKIPHKNKHNKDDRQRHSYILVLEESWLLKEIPKIVQYGILARHEPLSS